VEALVLGTQRSPGIIRPANRGQRGVVVGTAMIGYSTDYEVAGVG
jgi:hypothetical protein